MVNKRCSLGRPTYTVFQKLFVITSRKLLNETGYTQPAYDVIKFQHHKTVLYTTFTTTTLKLKYTSRYTLKSYFQQFLYHQKFWDNANNKMRKYRLQQLFEMLFLSLDTGRSRFLHVNDGLFKVSRQWLLQFSHVAYSILVYTLLHGAVVAMETAQVSLNPHHTFQTQSTRN